VGTVPTGGQLFSRKPGHENVFVSAVFGALSALEALCDYALYKSTFYLLTYLHEHEAKEQHA